ncbi:HelD family protein [Clostridium niameyense]|uniref:HelD family protein n=1 Tax=Clostridium niameyense TaxID=1622073 RepID=UPI00067ED372|nr:UvrD-helicase domain-containing protein [Clostridium niameyense]
MEQNENSLEKQIKIAMEKEYLEFVINKIKKETRYYVEKRKNIVEDIVKYRKENIDECKDDEDKIAEYFDHERYLKEQLYKFIDKKLREFTILENTPYFGKVVFSYEDDEDQIYIGRFGFSEEGNYKPIIIDWRAPICQAFYAGKLGNITYTSPDGEIDIDVKSKTQYLIKKGKLKGMFDSELDIKDEILQSVLSENSENKLKDIVMTIQKEQDDIIRQPKNKVIVVNGVAGSGKTTVALHRVAYLLYNYRKLIQDKLLVLGPNSVFIDYISEILPSLGENGVIQTTFLEFISKIVDTNSVMSYEKYYEKILVGDKEFIKELRYKQSQEFVDKLNEFINYLDHNYFKVKNVEFMGEIVVTKEEIEDMFYDYFKYMPLFKRSKKIKRIIFSKLKDARDKNVYKVQKEFEYKIKNLSEDEIRLERNNLEFIRKNAIREIIKKSMETKKQLKYLDGESIFEIYKKGFFIKENIIVDDLFAILYLKIKLEGIRIKKEIKHIVIDEAQDYSMLQFIILKELTGCKSFTVVGDENQRIIPYSGRLPMLSLDEILDRDEIEYFNLQKSYRSTKQIMDYANKYLNESKIVPLVRNGHNVIEDSTESGKSIYSKVNYYLEYLKEKGYENIAIITTTLDEAKNIGNDLKSIRYISLIDRENIIYSGGEVIMPSYLAKGLEFDATILLIKDEVKSNNLNYIMATRALHELIVINNEVV